MTGIYRILCPIDFSDFSRHAFDHAAAIARWYDARLSVLYVSISRSSMDLPPLVMTDADREQVLEESGTRARLPRRCRRDARRSRRRTDDVC
jgi:nucleotide-binding universal stress UspA family protein